MIVVLVLVAVVSMMVTLLTYSPSEGFITESDALKILDGLKGDNALKAQYLNNPELFDITDDMLEIKMPIKIERELRVIGKDCKVEGYTESGKRIVGIGLNSKNVDQSYLSKVLTSGLNNGAVPLKYYVISENGSDNTLGEMAGHRFNYGTNDNKFIPGYPKHYDHPLLGVKIFSNKQDALYACDAHPYCKGVTYDKNKKTYTLRGDNVRIHNGMEIKLGSSNSETSYVKIV